MGRLSVLLTTEATYPFHQGGVSTWCHTLTHRLPEMDFHLLAVIMHPFLQCRYAMAQNVRSLLKVPLWGTEDPVEYSWHQPFSKVLRIKWRTTEDAIQGSFTAIFERACDSILRADPDPDELGEILLDLHSYFREFDFHQTRSSPPISSKKPLLMRRPPRDQTRGVATVPAAR
jgi:polysaccharide biosynthesis protein PelF